MYFLCLSLPVESRTAEYETRPLRVRGVYPPQVMSFSPRLWKPTKKSDRFVLS